MSSPIYTFWYSQEHAEHLERCDYLRFFPSDKPTRALVEINGEYQVYTACRNSADNVNEPYDRALEIFPDYRIIGQTTIDKVRVVSPERVIQYLNRNSPDVKELERMFAL